MTHTTTEGSITIPLNIDTVSIFQVLKPVLVPLAL